MAWINMCPESSTWSTLVEALTEVGHRKVAHEVAERRGEEKHKNVLSIITVLTIVVTTLL